MFVERCSSDRELMQQKDNENWSEMDKQKQGPFDKENSNRLNGKWMRVTIQMSKCNDLKLFHQFIWLAAHLTAWWSYNTCSLSLLIPTIFLFESVENCVFGTRNHFLKNYQFRHVAEYHILNHFGWRSVWIIITHIPDSFKLLWNFILSYLYIRLIYTQIVSH